MAKILIAEDDTGMREFLAKTLVKAGYDVIACPDGLSALAALKAEAFDLLLTDIVMPGIDGLELATRGRALYPALRVVYLTGFTAMTQTSQASESVHIRTIAKPFHLNDLTRQIEEILAV